MLAGSAARLLIQAVYFVMIARGLGAEQYGAFIGVVALVAVLAPFAPFGTGQILVRNVARDRGTFRQSWGNALFVTGVSGSILLGLALVLARLCFARQIPVELVLFVGMSDLLFAATTSICSMAFQAVEKLHHTAQVNLSLTSARAIAALVLLLSIKEPTALSWGFFYCGSSVIAAGYAIVFVCSRLGNPQLNLQILRSDLTQCFYFSVSLSSASIYNNIDKTMLVRLANFGAAGIYGAAYRLVDLSFQPIASLLASTYPLFFRHGTEGLAGTKRLLKRFLPLSLLYAVVAGAVLILAAPVLPSVLGRGFGQAVAALYWLSPLTFLRAAHYLLADCLTGAGFQGLRSGIQILTAGLNVALNLWLIPKYSWRGAAWTSLGCDAALALGMLAAVIMLSRRSIGLERRIEHEVIS